MCDTTVQEVYIITMIMLTLLNVKFKAVHIYHHSDSETHTLYNSVFSSSSVFRSGDTLVHNWLQSMPPVLYYSLFITKGGHNRCRETT